jgi:hypothetical protein
VVTPEGKIPLGRSRRRWVNNIKIVLREIGWACMYYIVLAQDREQWKAVVNKAINPLVPGNCVKFLSSYTTVSFSRSSMELVQYKMLNLSL